MSFEQTHTDFVRYCRWFCILTDSTDWRIEDKGDCRTACTDGRTVWFTPAFFDATDNAERFFVALHEVLHIAKKHCLIRVIDGIPVDYKILNKALDEIVNRECIAEMARINAMAGKIVMRIPDCGVLLTPRFDDMTETEVYRILLAEKQDENQDDSSESDPEGDSGDSEPGNDENDDSGSDSDENSETGGTESPENAENGIGGVIPSPDFDDVESSDQAESERIDRIVEQSAQVAQQAGTLAGALAKIASDNRKPKTNLQAELSRHVSRQYRADRSFRSFDRHYRRLGIPYPAKQDSTDSLAVYLDCSYSIGLDELNQQIEEVNNLLLTVKPARIDLFGFHTQVFQIQTIQRNQVLQPIEEIQQGGTSFDSVISHFADDTNRLAIVFTDGWDYTQSTSDKPIIWIIQEGGQTENNLPGKVITL